MYYINNDVKTIDTFDMSKFMDFTDDGVFDCMNSYMLLMIPTLPVTGYYTLRKEFENPPYLSYTLYNDTQYWWILMVYNGFTLPNQLKSGTIIKYPSLSSIEQLYGNASLQSKVN